MGIAPMGITQPVSFRKVWLMDKVQMTLRLPYDLAKYVEAKADGIGISTNAFLMILIDKGLALYECDIIQRVEVPSQ